MTWQRSACGEPVICLSTFTRPREHQQRGQAQNELPRRRWETTYPRAQDQFPRPGARYAASATDTRARGDGVLRYRREARAGT